MSNCGESIRVVHPLFQEEGGGSTPTSPLHFEIRSISNSAAEQWVKKWHYSARIPTGKNISYCLYADHSPYAVIVYGIGVNPYQAKFLGVSNVLEIKRMCRSEPRLDGFPLSKFISITSKMVKKQFNYDCLVAFADPEHGHEGTVYKAAGFTLHGLTNAEWHLEGLDGDIRHRRYAFRYARRNGKTVAESRELLGMKRVQTKQKYRWVRMFPVIPSKKNRCLKANDESMGSIYDDEESLEYFNRFIAGDR